MGFPRRAYLATILSIVLAIMLAPTASWACGGLFCDSAGPVNQTAERIIFVDHEDGMVSAAVEILYQGPAEDFSWLSRSQGSLKWAYPPSTCSSGSKR